MPDESLPNWSPLNYMDGNVILVNGGRVYFVTKDQGLALDNENRPLSMSRKEMDELDISLRDGDHLSAESAEELVKFFGLGHSAAFNPFGYQDNKFKLGCISVTNSMHHLSDDSQDEQVEGQQRIAENRRVANSASSTAILPGMSSYVQSHPIVVHPAPTVQQSSVEQDPQNRKTSPGNS